MIVQILNHRGKAWVEISAYEKLLAQLSPVHCGLAKIVTNELFDSIVKERDDLMKLLAGEEVELQCKNPGYQAAVRLVGDKAIITESWDKSKLDSKGKSDE